MNIFEQLPLAKLEEKERLFSEANLFLCLAKKVHREGILSLEEYAYDGMFGPFSKPNFLSEAEKSFFNNILGLILDGQCNSEQVSDIARYYVSSFDTKTYGSPLALMIGSEGFASILNQDSIPLMASRLAAMMGYPLGNEFISVLREREWDVDESKSLPMSAPHI